MRDLIYFHKALDILLYLSPSSYLMWILEIESFKFPIMVLMRDPNHDLFLKWNQKKKYKLFLNIWSMHARADKKEAKVLWQWKSFICHWMHLEGAKQSFFMGVSLPLNLL